jgi:hypothetical protein
VDARVPNSYRPFSRPTLPPVQYVSLLFAWGKSAGAWRQSPTPSSAEVKTRVELNLYSRSGPSRPVTGTTLILLAVYFWIAEGKTNYSVPNDSRYSLIPIVLNFFMFAV